MDIITELKLQAKQEKLKLDKRKLALEKELTQAKQRVSELESALFLSSSSDKRILDFQPFLNGHFQCPRCWVVKGIHTDLFQVGSIDFDIVECRAKGCVFHAKAPV